MYAGPLGLVYKLTLTGQAVDKCTLNLEPGYWTNVTKPVGITVQLTTNGVRSYPKGSASGHMYTN